MSQLKNNVRRAFINQCIYQYGIEPNEKFLSYSMYKFLKILNLVTS